MEANAKTSRFSAQSLSIALLVLLISLLLTGIGWYFSFQYVRDRERFRFEETVSRMEFAILQRMDTYLVLLRSGERFFAGSEEITRSEWRTFVQADSLKRRYPGIQGLGYTIRIPKAELQAHEARVRAEGFPSYRVWPTRDRPEYHSIVYLEPFDWRNRRAFGYDMHTEATRRTAMDRARDTGNPAMTGKVRLVQETKEGPQPGFLIYVPVYRQNAPLHTIAERRAALRGFVYSPFRAVDLFQGILGRLEERTINFELFDGRVPRPGALLYDDNPEQRSPFRGGRYRPQFERRVQLEMAGHPWTLYFSELRTFETPLERNIPFLVAIAGTIISTLLAGIALILSTGRERAVAIARDMTADLRKADQAKDEFLSVTSHELRTPLNFISGFASILSDELPGPLNASQHEYVCRIMQGTDRMLTLVNNLLDVSEMAAGRFQIFPEAVLYPQLVEEVVASLRPHAEEKSIALKSEVAFLGAITVDSSRIKQVLGHLIENAIKFTPTGGHIEVRAFAEGSALVTEVVDDGLGISPENQSKLFQRFSQIDMSSTRKAGGVGLGLSISKTIVEAHGGTIGVESTPGRGSRFWYSLPLPSARKTSDLR